MNSMQIELLNPKAGKLLKELAALNLISIRDSNDDGFLSILNTLRTKAKNNPPTLDEITKEVEIVRAKRYAKSKR
jgi:hypothetical protein